MVIHAMGVPEDERRAAEAIYRHLTGAVGDLDPAHEARRIAQLACRAARPVMWLKLLRQIEELEAALEAKGGMAAGGMCCHCGCSLRCARCGR